MAAFARPTETEDVEGILASIRQIIIEEEGCSDGNTSMDREHEPVMKRAGVSLVSDAADAVPFVYNTGGQTGSFENGVPELRPSAGPHLLKPTFTRRREQEDNAVPVNAAPARDGNGTGRLPSPSSTNQPAAPASDTTAVTADQVDGKTIEGLVREMLRPMLQAWLDRHLPYMLDMRLYSHLEHHLPTLLDQHLPQVVERLVRDKIEKITCGL